MTSAKPQLLPVSMFWMGEKLSTIELASILSIQRAGHKITLFSYGKPKGIPSGVQLVDASEILPREEFVFYRRTNPSLGSNLFRYKMLAAERGLWLDSDMLLLRGIEGDGSEIFGWQDETEINGAVLFLPKNSVVLADLLKYTDNRYPVPPFFDKTTQSQLVVARMSGKPIHVSQMPWGVWGPFALTYFIKKNARENMARSTEVFYPVHSSEAHMVFAAGSDVDARIMETTLAVHLWNNKLKKPSRIRPKISPGPVYVERGSYFDRFCKNNLDLKVSS